MSLMTRLGRAQRGGAAAAAGEGGEAAAPPVASLSPLAFLAILAQLALVAVAVRQFQVESNAFFRLTLVAIAGFALHAWLPFRFRLPFFVALSIAAMGLIFGVQSAWLIGVGLVLIAICHLPILFWGRVGLLLAVGLVLAVQRAGGLAAPWSDAIWPILASLFMFRLIVYLYDLRHDTTPRSPWSTLAYFFMLPNVCFPLFPVVDYKTFRRNYYSDDAARIYQVGIDWIARGILQLILYRFVYQYLALAPAEVTGPGELLRFLVSNFLLYLRVSGQFHVIVGMLHLFGFNLPETHYRYLLASSFTDFWRRINIYWKDFMLKLFYYPTYFALRKLGNTPALVLSTIVVFAATWLLHAYQWFWLRGTFLLAGPDMAFWGILACLVIVNSLYEMRHGRPRTLGVVVLTVRARIGLALRTLGTFAAICSLWALWTSESLRAWFFLWTAAAGPLTPDPLLWPIALTIGLVVLGAMFPDRPGRAAPKGVPWLSLRTATTVGCLLVTSLLGISAVYRSLGPALANPIHALRSGTLNRVDNALLERGYYEDLLRVDRFNSQLWEVYMARPVEALEVVGHGVDRFRGDFLQRELTPSVSTGTRFGTMTINRWGMRDRDYERQPAAGAYRIAVLGSSTVMGWGVGDTETFEAVLEERLNRERAGRPFATYELLNFAVNGYRPLQQLPVLDRALSFHPDTLLYVATGREGTLAARYLVEIVQKGIEIPYPYLREVVARAGLEARTEENAALRRLEPYRGEMLSWLYRQIAEGCRARGVVPVLVFLPQAHGGAWQEETPEILRRAEEAGFTVVDLDDVYRGLDIKSIRLSEWDSHPNAAGHRLIAGRLYEELTSRWETVVRAR